MSDSLNLELLRVESLSKNYVRGNLWRGRVPVKAAQDINFKIRKGQTLALVGASGSGKSTVARCVARLEKPDDGQVLIEGMDIANLSSRELRPLRSQVQMIFQDAITSMNPRFSAAEVIEEPILLQGKSAQERREIAAKLIKEVGLPIEALDRSVMEFSGGQRQRIAIARALTLQPKLLILDEALSGLDLSTQARIANLLLDLQPAHTLSYLLISHDLALVSRMADEVAVMSGGRIVEHGTTQQIVNNSQHDETKKLLASAKATENNLQPAKGASA